MQEDFISAEETADNMATMTESVAFLCTRNQTVIVTLIQLILNDTVLFKFTLCKGFCDCRSNLALVLQDFCIVELMGARLDIRNEQERSAIDRVKAAYGEKYDFAMMAGCKQDIASLLHEEMENRSVRDGCCKGSGRYSKSRRKRSKTNMYDNDLSYME